METASPTLFFPPTAAPGYGAAPPASRVATAIAARRAYGPPLTPQPLRPSPRSRHGQAHSPCPPEPHGARLISRSNPYKQSLYGFQGIARARMERVRHQDSSLISDGMERS